MRRLRPTLFAALLLLSVAACEERSPVDNAANAIAPATVDNSSEGAASSGPPAVSNGADASGSIPVAIQGRWGLTPADCTTTRGDAKGLLTITADQIQFYESRGTPGTSIESADTGISGNFNFTGEGQSWSKYVSLKLQGNGLVRTERSPMASYTYAKC